MSKRLLILMCSIFLVVPLLFMGCGNDGATGATGLSITGPPGPPGPPGSAGGPGTGVAANETCAICHGVGKIADVAALHNLNPTTGAVLLAGTVNAAITGATFAPAGDNVITTITFTFQALNDAGADVTGSINLLDNSSATQLRFVRFSLAKLVPGTVFPSSGTQGTNEWFDYVNGSRVNGKLVRNNPGVSPANYTYTFPDNAVTVSGAGSGIPAVPYNDNNTTRAAIQISGLTLASFTANTNLIAPVANPTFDLVPNGSAIVTTKDDVTTAACNACHDPLALHGGGRIETKFCVICHNPTLPSTTDNVSGLKAGALNFGPFVHRIHGDNTITNKTLSTSLDFNEVTYPQSIENCKTCHKGTDNFWQTRPSAESCGSCHSAVNFTTGANHVGGAQPTDQFCALCHPASGPGSSITNRHATEVSTFNNPQLPPGLFSFQYGIDTVTVDNANRAVVKFWIKQAVADASGVVGPYSFFTLPTDNTGKVTQPAGLTGSPGFLLAWALAQDGVSAPSDYNNLGRAPAGGTGLAGQPPSVNIVGLTVTGTSTQYTATLASAPFPAGATMRAVAMQGAFVQTYHNDGPPPIDNVELAVPSVVKAVTGDAVRRVIVKSGYNATTGAPEGCLECHEFFVGHGGSRNNNVQVCVICHNPNLTTSGRTINANPINPDIVALYGSNPLTYPEVADNLKALIHGFHASGDDPLLSPNEFARTYPYIDIRNRLNGVLLNGSEVTYPGSLRHCTKCHNGPTVPTGDTTPPGFVANSYKADLPANLLNTTTRITTGNPAETRAQIIGARDNVPNTTDLVVSPLASACGYCHDSNAQVSHMILNGAAIQVPRGDANLVVVPILAPDVTP
jgi:OmcA/MtrC family decaheme c-type cytochrome